MNPTTGRGYENLGSSMQVDQSNTSTVYICGSCGNDNEIRPKENIQCKDCGGRIFYKKRTRRLVQYEAR